MRFFFTDVENPLNFSVCGQLISKDSFLHMKRKINENVLIFVQQGTLYINSNNKNFQISKNQFIILKAEEIHFGYKESFGELKYFWVHFKDTLNVCENNETEISKQNYFFPENGTINNNSRLILLFRQMMDFSLEKISYNKKILDYSFSIFMMEFMNDQINIKNQKKLYTNPIVNDICNWIKLNFQNDFSIDDLASNLNLQSNYLSKLFKQYMNKTIIQYTTELRIESAKNLLMNFSVKETAYSCGFSDDKYFMKIFKKIEGITPTEYKQAFSLRNVNQ